ncbi:tubulin epsilon chain-like isoform X3 [Lycorma delicatula]|uniref:tubulin epsilon chain-like isoform X3 n=1 Tax=Lycorma delicatula TaxID=130591 RepID=UPI003F514854
MSEIITIQVGQCGNQIGSTFWPLVLKEHGISTDIKINQKSVLSDALPSFFYCPSDVPQSGYSSISDLKKANVKARCILIDMEENVVGRYNKGPLRDLFDQTCFLTDLSGSGNNWGVGYYEHGNEQKESILEILRRTAEQCDYLHGFLMFFSLGGGTGSGLGSNVLSLLEDNFDSVDRLVTCVHPGPFSDVITSPYNIAFTLRKLTEHASCVFPVDNKALSDICSRLKPSREISPWIPYSDINSVIAKMLLHLTSGCRFPGSLNVDLNELATNMTPFQGLHYLTSSFCPLEPDTTFLKQADLFTSVCSRSNQLLRIDPFAGTILSATLLCRGDMSLSASREYVNKFYKKAQLVSWNQNGVKTGLCSSPLPGYSKSVLCLTNSTSMSRFFRESLIQFNKLYKKKVVMMYPTLPP